MGEFVLIWAAPKPEKRPSSSEKCLAQKSEEKARTVEMNQLPQGARRGQPGNLESGAPLKS